MLENTCVESLGFFPTDGTIRRIDGTTLTDAEKKINFTDFAHKYKDTERGSLFGIVQESIRASLTWDYMRHHQYDVAYDVIETPELEPGFESVVLAGVLCVEDKPVFEFRYHMEGHGGLISAPYKNQLTQKGAKTLTALDVLEGSHLQAFLNAYHELQLE